MNHNEHLDRDVLDVDESVEHPAESTKREWWPWLFPVAGFLLFEWLANPVVATVVGCLKFGWQDFRTAVWLGNDPHRARGEALRWCYLAYSVYRVAWSTVLVFVALIALDGIWVVVLRGAQQNQLQFADCFISGLVLVVIGVILGVISTCKAFRRVIRGGVRVWMDPTIHQARREQRWDNVCHGRWNRFHVLCVASSLATASWLGFLGFTFLWGGVNPNGNEPAWLPVFGILFFGWPAMYCLGLARRSWAQAASSPAECWDSNVSLTSGGIPNMAKLQRRLHDPQDSDTLAIPAEAIGTSPRLEPGPGHIAHSTNESPSDEDGAGQVWFVLGGLALSLLVLIGLGVFVIKRIQAPAAPQAPPIALRERAQAVQEKSAAEQNAVTPQLVGRGSPDLAAAASVKNTGSLEPLAPTDSLVLPQPALDEQGQFLSDDALKAIFAVIRAPALGNAVTPETPLEIGSIVVAKKPGTGDRLAAVRDVKVDDKFLVGLLGDAVEPFEVSRADLRLPPETITKFVSASAFAITPKTELRRGMLLETDRGSNRWRPVIVLETHANGKVKIRYIGWSTSWDSAVDRSKLRFPTGMSSER